MKESTFCPLDKESARRTMDLYFGPQPEPLPDFDDLHLMIASPDLDPQLAGRKGLQMLECAASCAFENAYRLTGKGQQQALVLGHLVGMSRQLMEFYWRAMEGKAEPGGKNRGGKKQEANGKAP